MGVCARTLYRLQEKLLGRETFGILRQLRDSERWSADRLWELKRQRLQGLLCDAARNVPYWRAVLRQCGLAEGRIDSLDDLRRAPLLTKDILRRQGRRMVWSQGERRVRMARTSGSTNEPLEFYTGSTREAHINAARMRGHEWVGIRKGDREMYFWGCPVELNLQGRIRRVRDWLVNDGLTDAFGLTGDLVRRHFAAWLRWRPKAIFCYPSSLCQFVVIARKAGLDLLRLKQTSLKCIITTAEPLGGDREVLQEAFGVPVYDSYGLREAGLLAHECEHQTMHLVEEQLVLETIDPVTAEPTDGEGELVVTNLVGRAMPLIRYRTGDVVRIVPQACPCGRSLRGVEVCGGRVTDHLVTSDGRWVSGIVFVYLPHYVDCVEKMQIHQHRIGEVEVLLVVNDRYTPECEQQVRQYVQARLKCPDRVVVRRVDHIAPSPSGKHRLVISTLTQRAEP